MTAYEELSNMLPPGTYLELTGSTHQSLTYSVLSSGWTFRWIIPWFNVIHKGTFIYYQAKNKGVVYGRTEYMKFLSDIIQYCLNVELKNYEDL